MNARVLLVDDHQIVVEGLRRLLEAEPGIEVIGEANDGRTAVVLCCDMRPDVAVMDVSMRDLNGIDATRRILEEAPGTSVIILSGSTQCHTVRACLQVGARAYLSKESAFTELVSAIRAVCEGRAYLSSDITSCLLEDFSHGNRDADGGGPVASAITPREREVLQLLVEGHSMKQIAGVLSLSVKTVEFHRRQTMQKLELDSLAALIRYAIDQGITPSE